MISDKEKIIYSMVVVVAVGFGMYSLRTQNSSPHADQKVVTYKDIKNVRNHAITKDKFEKQKVEVKNWQTAPRLEGGVREIKDSLNESSSGIKIESQKNFAAIDAADASVYEAPVTSLETQINKKLVNDQVSAQMSQLQKIQFIENYKRRALAVGYEVELNDQLQLVKATKIKPRPSFEKAPASAVDIDSMEEDYYDEGEE